MKRGAAEWGPRSGGPDEGRAGKEDPLGLRRDAAARTCRSAVWWRRWLAAGRRGCGSLGTEESPPAPYR